MAQRGAQPGNTNAAKGRILFDALRQAAAKGNWLRLRQGADKIMDAFAAGEPWAAQFVADRLDGKVMPMLPDTGDGTLVISWIQSAQPAPVDVTPQPQTIEHAAKPEDEAGVP